MAHRELAYRELKTTQTRSHRLPLGTVTVIVVLPRANTCILEVILGTDHDIFDQARHTLDEWLWAVYTIRIGGWVVRRVSEGMR
jgi:hypothetical protein